MKKLFAAIDVGSYELSMKIFEFGKKSGVKEIDCVRHRIDIGNDTFHTGLISPRKMDELCDILSGFSKVMESYKVTDYLAYGTSAIRETVNTSILLDQIEERTGIKVSVLSNSEQRFLEYKGAALRSDFDDHIKQGAAFLDIGGGSSQITLFSEGHLVTTVNLHLGTLRIRSKIRDIEPVYSDQELLIGEIVSNELDYFKELYLNDLKVYNIIIIDDYLSAIMTQVSSRPDGHILSRSYKEIMKALSVKTTYQIAERLFIPEENASLLIPSAIIVDKVISITGATDLYMPGVSLADGIAYDYADKKNYIRSGHDFTDDILSSANNIAERYGAFDSITNKMVSSALAIFDATKTLHGMTDRERLLLEISAILRNSGKYVSMSMPAEVTYSIILNSEIIGISHQERKIIGTVAKYSYPNNISYEAFDIYNFSEKEQIIAAKLTAILRVATGIAKNVDKTIDTIKAAVKERELIIKVTADDKMLLEKGLFSERCDTFEEIFGITPVLRVIKK